ncbi:hypothetical protein ACVIGB_001148 [Bradyrhizobium sp. USDA 4341]
MAARFECTAHAARQILTIVRREGLASNIKVNPEGELEDSDRIHVVLENGELSGNALYCSPESIVVESADGKTVAHGPSWSLEDMVDNFMSCIREEASAPALAPC